MRLLQAGSMSAGASAKTRGAIIGGPTARHRILNMLFKILEQHGFKVKLGDRREVYFEIERERVDFNRKQSAYETSSTLLSITAGNISSRI
jgi:hypothetical protein